MVFDLKDITLWETMFSLDSDAGMSVKMPAAGENADLEQEVWFRCSHVLVEA